MGDAVAEDVEFGLAHGLFPFVSPPAYVARAPQTKANYLQTDWCALFRRHTFRTPIGVCARLLLPAWQSRASKPRTRHAAVATLKNNGFTEDASAAKQGCPMPAKE